MAVTERRRFTADEYQRMGQVGILSAKDRVELIDGEVVAMSPIGPPHSAHVDRANRAFVLKAGDDAIVRVQGAVRLDLFNEPQPDVVLLRPRPDFYESAHPGPADILLVVEVADSSLDFDRSVKMRLYARMGVPDFWLVDVKAHELTRFNDPAPDGYRAQQRDGRGRLVAPVLLPACVVSTDDLLGPANGGMT